MDKKKTGGFGAFLLVAVFVWVVFDNMALGLLFGMMAAGATYKALPAGVKDGDP